MQIVVFDLLLSQPNNKIKYHGGGEYTKNIFRCFVEYNKLAEVIVCYDFSRFLDSDIKLIIDKCNIQAIDVKTPKMIIDYLCTLPKKSGITFFAGMIYAYNKSVFPTNVKSIGVCHGLRFIEIPKDRFMIYYSDGFKSWTKAIAKILATNSYLRNRNIEKIKDSISCFDVIYTVSYHSKYAMKLYLQGKTDNDFDIRVHYQAIKKTSMIKDMDFFPLSDNYILMISSDRWEKNSYRGITAIDELISEGKLKDNVNVKVLGDYPSKLRKKIKNISRFVFDGYLDPEGLERAYRGCKVFFYPTLNEGFGLPPLEAMRYKKTCVIAAVCSLTEVYGDSVYYCNPYDIGEMKIRLIEALDMPIPDRMIENRINWLSSIQRETTKELLDTISGN